MSTFGFGGFGANNNNNNNNQQQQQGFGGFGANNTSGFGQQQSNAFGGANNSSGSLFGAGAPGFGGSTSTPFGGGNKPAFGSNATGGGSIFGGGANTTATTGAAFGGFGSQAASSSTPFGNAAPGVVSGGIFGASKPAFGSTPTTGSNLFGSNTGGTGFGQTTTNTVFGAPQSTALGGNVAECLGTGSTPFTAWTERENTTTNHYQNISFMQPYSKFSPEELRLADYNQGRRYGNDNGQAGAFGAATPFGGFGQAAQTTANAFGGTGSNIFGTQPATNAAFGAATQTTGGFGGGTNSLFGAKPAGSLFSTTPATSAQPTGGIFGSSGQGGFGATQTGGFGSGGSNLFGPTQAQQEQPKSGFSFGTATNAGPSAGFGGTAFGATPAATSNPFGAATQPTSLFGTPQPQQQATTVNAFGQPAQAQGGFGSGFGTTQQQKPGLFGPINTNQGTASTGVAGQQAATSNIFGTSNNQASNSLFGPKPAVAGTPNSLFGAQNNNTGGSGLFGGGFGSNTTQNQPTPNPFGGNNQQQQQQQKTGLFGGASGGGLFGNNNQQPPNAGSIQNQQGGSIFGNAGNNGSSIFGNTQQNSLSPPQAMTASHFDQNPYGNSSIFHGLPAPPQSSPGPIATPLTGGHKTRKPAALPQYKINPIKAAQSQMFTPQKRGFGFTYSTYGTPSSVTSIASTPGGIGSSLLGSSIGRSLGKSYSTSNLRSNFDNADSILSPGAFSAGSSRYSGGGSMKKLTIDRNLRTDMFGSQGTAAVQGIPALPSPEKPDLSRQSSSLKKRVSFDTNSVSGSRSGNDTNGSAEVTGNGMSNGTNNLTHNEEHTANPSVTPSAQEQGFLRSSSRINGRNNLSKPASVQVQPEMEQIKGNELAIVHEDGSPEIVGAMVTTQERSSNDQQDPQPGEYYMKPSREELRKMSRDQLRKVSNFSLGREECGHVVFDHPVDLTTVDVDNIFGNICVINLRSLTIYPDTPKKPPVGKGLNVPSTITLRNSWPRQRDKRTPSYEKGGTKFHKHVDRLKKVTNTEFVKYDKDSGEWVFRVPHFTTYGFEYDEEETEVDALHSSILSECSQAPDTPTPKSRTPKFQYTPKPASSMYDGSSILTNDSSRYGSGPDDTFDFKKKKLFPGAFDETPAFEEDQEMEEVTRNGESFLEERSATSASEVGDDEPSDLLDETQTFQPDNSLIVQQQDLKMAGSFPRVKLNAEALPASLFNDAFRPATPGKLLMGDDWAQQLQRTISPRKQDRYALRESQAHFFNDSNREPEITPKATTITNHGPEIVTSIDLMNSLFGREAARKSVHGGKTNGKAQAGKWPYTKQIQEHDPQLQMDAAERSFHNSFKPAWGPQSRLLHPVVGKSSRKNDDASQTTVLMDHTNVIVSNGRDIQILSFKPASDIHFKQYFLQQLSHVEISTHQGVPFAAALPYAFNSHMSDYGRESGHETQIFQLASILFDRDHEDLNDIPIDERPRFASRMRKERLARWWAVICRDSAQAALAAAPSAEERALAFLSMNKINEACHTLIAGMDFRLATLIAQIGGDKTVHNVISNQIGVWRKLNILSEMTEPIRALYELLAGNTCVCEGKRGAVEDQARSFVISERFKMDWRRAFGLRLWYGTLTEEPLEVAIEKFARDLRHEETSKTLPPFIDKDLVAVRTDAVRPKREDPLWGLLKLYSDYVRGTNTTRIADVVMPQNIHGNPLYTRLSFELYHALATRMPAHVDLSSADKLAWDFATELEAAGDVPWAILTILHISKHEERQQALQIILAKHAAQLDETNPAVLHQLFDVFKIPDEWVWEAKALYARSVLHDHVKEVDYLLRARNWDEAHQTLCRVVAPQAIIEQDYTVLQQLLTSFVEKGNVRGWMMGGQIYDDYVRLVKGSSGLEKQALITRLLKALPAMVKDGGKLSFAEMVAVQEMSEVVASAVLQDKANSTERFRILQLPLADNAQLKHTAHLSLQYYSALMAGGK